MAPLGLNGPEQPHLEHRPTLSACGPGLHLSPGRGLQSLPELCSGWICSVSHFFFAVWIHVVALSLALALPPAAPDWIPWTNSPPDPLLHLVYDYQWTLRCDVPAPFRYCGAVLWLAGMLPVLWSPSAPGLSCPEQQQPCSCCSLREL